jgi:hypothetical protein
MKSVLGLVLPALPTAALAQSEPYKLIITWYQSSNLEIDYPSLARCERAKMAVEREVDRRRREQESSMPPGSVTIGKSPNGAFCIPG